MPILKKSSRNQKKKYKSLNNLLISKIFEKILSKQLWISFENILAKFQCGFRKGFSTRHYLLLMIEKGKEAVDKEQSFGALLTALLKAFDCLSHDLLTAKFHCYGISLASLKSITDYLNNGKQRTKVGTFYSSWEDIKNMAFLKDLS